MIALGLDLGEKRIGVAKSDELGMFAHAVGFIERPDDEAACINEIKKCAEECSTNVIVVGLPKKLDGSAGIAEEGVRAFVEKLKEHIDVPFELWEKKRKKVDSIAAQIMLQGYLDVKKGSLF